MFKIFLKAIVSLSFVIPTMSWAQQTRTLEERVAELEANASLNIFTFSGIFQTRYDNVIKAHQTTPASGALNSKDLSYLRMKFQLNADADVSKYVKFYSRFTTSKLFNSFSRTGTTSPDIGVDLGASNRYESSAVYLEKAYADISIPDSHFTFSIGRLPTVDGQPQNYKDGRARSGTYPQMSYNSVFDGFALTYKMDEYLSTDHQLALRLIYTPFSQTNMGGGDPLLKPPSNIGGTSTNETSVPMGAFMADYSVENMRWTEKMGVVFQHYQTGDIYYAVPPASTLQFATSGTTLAFDLQGVAHTGWDLSLSYLASTTKSTGLYLGTGFGTAAAADTIRGGNFLLSTCYRLPNWVFGFEYASGTKDSLYYASNDETLSDFYATKGDAYHIYVTKKFTQNLSLRVGYMDQQYRHSSMSSGPIPTSDRKIETAYSNFRMDF